MKISQVKSIIQIIVTNLKELQTFRDSLTQNNFVTETVNIEACRQRLEEAFASLKSEILEKLVIRLKKRKTNRLRRNTKLKMKKNQNKSSRNSCRSDKFTSRSCLPRKQPINTLKKIQLQKSKQYLATMDSLESLHKLKGGGDSCKLKESLNSIRSIWQSTAQTIGMMEQYSSIETQWYQVLFGENEEIDMKHGLRDFIDKRRIWDSYLVPEDDITGSQIPIGLVYPKEDSLPEWKEFKCKL